ncbi:MAG TPA: BrnA antitoxin family protein [Burkholderiales bacterium]|jgi:uncharacterized protein (DUF4415 family)|nr:BrnA antitoxin family protein [Burkholderiales bacterium]
MGKARLAGGRPRHSARLRGPGAAASRGEVRLEGERGPRNKTRLTMYLDTAVVEYFRTRSGGRGYQTLINEALKQAIERENLEDVLRRVLREETRPYKAGKG